jgi:hypothetical protein
MAKILKQIDDAERVSYSVRHFTRNSLGAWVQMEGERKEAKSVLPKGNILYGPFFLCENGQLPKKTLNNIVARVKEERLLTQQIPSVASAKIAPIPLTKRRKKNPK